MLADLPPSCLLLAALLCAGRALAAEPVWMERGDWALQCDNTRRCSAVGYQAESDRDRLATVRIARDAGPGALPGVEVQAIAAGSDERRWRGPLRLHAGAMAVDALPGVPAKVRPEQAGPLVEAMLASAELRLAGGSHRWSISFDGFRQVLARMDEVQQPGPDTPPVIHAVLPARAVASDARLASAIFRELNPDDADVCSPPLESHRQLSVRRLSADRLLVSAACLNGVYDGDRHWLASLRAPHQPRLLDGIEGRFEPRRGTITEQHKLIGYGSCYLVRQWQLTEAGFTLASERADRMCRGFPDGAWDLPVHVSRVLPPAGPVHSFSSNRN